MRMARSAKDRLHLIDTDFSNLRTSMNWLAEQDDRGSAELLLDYLDTLFPFLYQKRHYLELEKWCTAGLRACQIAHRSQAGVLVMKGETQFALGRWKDAQLTVKLAVTESKERDASINAQAMFVLGRLQIELGEYNAALVTLKRAEELYTELGNIGKIIEIRSEVGAYYLNKRDLDKALELFLALNELHNTTGNFQSFDHTQMMIGVVYRQKREFEKAIEYLDALYKRGKTQPGQSTVATAAIHLAWVYFEQGNLADARKMCGEAIARYLNQQDMRGLSDAYEQLAAILTEEQQPNQAEDYLERSINIRRQIGNQPGLVSSLRRLALVRLLLKNYGGAFWLIGIILVKYFQMNMLSRQRMMKLIKDAFTGIRKAVLYRKYSHNSEKNRGGSVMEKFFGALFGINKP
jgi:tetratricopeptide (TPR) repeat protein